MIEFRFAGKIGIELRSCAPRGAGHHLGQAMIGLRPQHDIDVGGAAQNLRSLRLGHAAGDRDDGLPAGFGALLFCDFQAAELGEEFFRRLFTDMARVHDHHIRGFRRLDRGIAQRRQRIRHAGGIVDVHLAAIGLDEEFFRQNLSARGLRGALHDQRSAAVHGISEA